MKWESSSFGFMFDACPACGFAYGTTADNAELRGVEVWEILCTHHGKTRATFASELLDHGIDPNGIKTVFDYSKDTPEEIQACVANPSTLFPFEDGLNGANG